MSGRYMEVTSELRRTKAYRLHGLVDAASGHRASVCGLHRQLAVGSVLTLLADDGARIEAEVVACRGEHATVLGRKALAGVGWGRAAIAEPGRPGKTIAPCSDWLGRIVDALGEPLDQGPPLGRGAPVPTCRPPPAAVSRGRLGARIDLGIRVLDAFTPCRIGQRLGLFAGSGVGKSTLLAMIARSVGCDVVVIALIGERGREVREFIEDELGPDSVGRAITVVATSDSSPLMRRDAAYAAMTIAEFFRDRGQSVLLVMDSVTRFAHALREVAFATGEMPASRGYPPSVFSELPRLFERAGPGAAVPGRGCGSITAIFSVLVDGDDHDEPVADAVRGLLDGHIVLDRGIAQNGRFPAVDILRSISRTAPGCLSPGQATIAAGARAILARYASVADLLRLGAYRRGDDPESDRAIEIGPEMLRFLAQDRTERMGSDETFAALELILAGQSA